MNKVNFKQNKKIISSHFKLHWKIILILTISFLIFASIGMVLFFLGNKISFIAPTIIDSVNVPSMSDFLNKILFSITGISFFSFAAIVLINTIVIKEIKSGQITIWVTSSLSRTQILISKLVAIFIIQILVFMPVFLVIIVTSSLTQDANLYLGFVIYSGIQFIIFQLFLTTIYMLVAMIFSNRLYLGNIVNFIIIAYIFATNQMTILYEANPSLFSSLEFAQYIRLNALVAPALEFSTPHQSAQVQHLGVKIEVLIKSEHIINSSAWLYISPFVNIIIATGFGYTTNYIFNKKDLNI